MPKKNSKKVEAKDQQKKIKYIEAIGRRKEAVARVRLYPHTKNFGVGVYPEIKKKFLLINDKDHKKYFPQFELQELLTQPLEKANLKEPFQIEIKVKGGGKRGQAEATRLGLARALVFYNPELKQTMRSFGFLTCDARKVERKKFGLKKARKAPQWQKR